MNRNGLIAGVVASLAAGTAMAAQPAGPYIGILGGSTDMSVQIDEDYTYNRSVATWGAFAGWQITPYIGAELGFNRPNRIRETATDGEDVLTATARYRTWTASAIGTWPIGERWSLHVRAGAVRLEERYSVALNGEGLGSDSTSSTEFLWGGGVGLMVEGARMRLEYQRSDFDYGDAGTISLGIAWFLPWGR